MVNCKPERQTIGAGLPLWIEEWQIVDCQNSQGTALFGQNSVTIFSCVVRGLKIVLSLTLMGMEVNHVGIHVGPRSAHSTHQRRQVLVEVGDRQGLPMQHPPLHSHYKGDWVHQPALVKIEELVYGVRNLDLGDLHGGKW